MKLRIIVTRVYEASAEELAPDARADGASEQDILFRFMRRVDEGREDVGNFERDFEAACVDARFGPVRLTHGEPQSDPAET